MFEYSKDIKLYISEYQKELLKYIIIEFNLSLTLNL